MSDNYRDIESEHVRTVLPPDWKIIQRHGRGYVYESRDRLCVIASAAHYNQDNREWLHVSMSRENRVPSYEDMKRVKEIFIGNDKSAIQVFPKVSDHVNIHPFCLHLWCPLTGPQPWPDFGEGGTI